METTLRRITLFLSALEDLSDGYITVISNFDEEWSAGILRDRRPNLDDEVIALQLWSQGVPVIRLGDDELDDLADGVTVDVTVAAARYQVRVCGVGSLEDTDDDED